MDLRAIIDRYLELAGDFGAPVALERFAASRDELERAFAILDEDYHISRFFHFSTQPGASAFRINGFDHTHVSIDAAIQTVL
jgi:hypothetical protein